MKNGFSTIELLIAFAILFLVLPPILLLSFSGQTSSLDVRLTNGGVTRLATQMRDAIASTTANWNSKPLPWSGTFYAQTNNISSVSPCLKQIDASLDWTSGDRPQGVDASTYVPNIAEARALGLGNCNPFPPSDDWDNPEDPNWDVTPSELSGSGSGIATARINNIEYAFVTTWQNGNPSPSDLWAIDVSNPSNPNPVSSINTGKGLNGIVINDSYAFVLQNDSTNHLQVVDISNPTALTPANIVAQRTLPNATNAIGRSIFYRDGYVYIGTQYLACPASCASTQNNEFHIYNVSNPLTPTHVGRLNINHNINDIVVSGNNAYLATSDNSGELMVIDISNPTSLVHPDVSGKKFNPSGNLDGTSVYVLGSTAYLGRERATGSNFDFYALDVSNPTSITVQKSKLLSLNPNTAVIDMTVHGRFAFLVVSDSNNTFQVWDIRSHPSTFVKVHPSCPNILDLAKSRAVTYRNDVIFIVNDNNAALNVLRDNPTACGA